jgi:hypothetical protein
MSTSKNNLPTQPKTTSQHSQKQPPITAKTVERKLIDENENPRGYRLGTVSGKTIQFAKQYATWAEIIFDF